MTDYTIVAASEDGEMSRSELREYDDRYDAVYLRPAVGGGWYIKNIVTIFKDACPAGGPHRYVYLTTHDMGPGRYEPSGMYCDECHAPAPERDDL